MSPGSSPRHKHAWPRRVIGPVGFTGDYKAAGGQGPMPISSPLTVVAVKSK